MFDAINRWKKAGNERLELDYLLSCASPISPLQDRLEWLVELFRWLRADSIINWVRTEQQTNQLQAARVRFFLLKLNKNLDNKSLVAKTLRSILLDTQSLDLFCTTGLPAESGFFSETIDRILEKFLPRPPHEDQLGEVFVKVFSSKNDLDWLTGLDASLILEIWELFKFNSSSEEERVWLKLRNEIEDAVLFLAGQIRAFGLAPKIRYRMSKTALRERPFFEITTISSSLLRDLKVESFNGDHPSLKAFRYNLAQCRNELEVAHDHLNVYGVSVSIVYQLDRIEMLIHRIETLVGILLGERNNPQKMVQFLSSLIVELNDRESFRSFFGENLSLLSMKISEQSAETGEHYIARNPSDYRKMFRSSLGGGALTSITTVIKQLIESAALPYFAAGFFASLNYSISFIAIYGLHFTLATKQPAMTANALAAKMVNLEDPKSKKLLIDEIVFLMRSQGASIIGNLSAVVPFVLLISFVVFWATDEHMLDPSLAMLSLEKHSILGLTPIHAAFTGVLLWFSSIITGWSHNWIIYHEIPQALEANRRLKSMLGPTRLKKWATAFRDHFSGWIGNISLGFLLGMTPKILSFFGLPLDVRHVTLSTGTITLAASSLGWSVFYSTEFWLAICGIVGIGILNVSVSFFMAMFVALKARRIEAPMRETIYSDILLRFKSSPSSFFLFQKKK